MAQTRRLNDASNPFLLPGHRGQDERDRALPDRAGAAAALVAGELEELRRALGLPHGSLRRWSALLETPLDELLAAARERRRGDGLVTYSPKVFIPLTTLCRDVCGYCTFARPPRRGERAVPDRGGGARDRARRARRPAARRRSSRSATSRSCATRSPRDELAALGCETTLEYLGRVAKLVLEETGLLPHLNPGVMSRDELARAAAGLGLDGDHARDGLRPAVREGRAALGLAGQGAGPPARDDRARRRAARSRSRAGS